MKLVFALASLLFVKSGTFDVRSDVKVRIPAGARQVRLWIPLPQNDPAQSVQNLQIQSPYTYRTVTDSEGNKLLFIEAENPSRPEWNVIETFRLTRRETGADPVASATRSLTGQETANMRHYLEANKYVVIDDTIRKLANEIVGNEKNPVAAMSKINEWMIEHIDYYAKDPEHKSGTDEASMLFCLKNQTGNCGDMAALFTALARSMGIPTRIIYGSFFKPSLNAQDVDSDAHVDGVLCAEAGLDSPGPRISRSLFR